MLEKYDLLCYFVPEQFRKPLTETYTTSEKTFVGLKWWKEKHILVEKVDSTTTTKFLRTNEVATVVTSTNYYIYKITTDRKAIHYPKGQESSATNSKLVLRQYDHAINLKDFNHKNVLGSWSIKDMEQFTGVKYHEIGRPQ